MKPAAVAGAAAIAFGVSMILGAQSSSEPATPKAKPVAVAPAATPTPTPRAAPRPPRRPRLGLASVPQVARLRLPPKRRSRPRARPSAPRVLRSVPAEIGRAHV